MPFAAALSEHPDPIHAVGEVLGEVLERIGTEPDLVFLFATPGHAGSFERMVAAVEELLRPCCFIGAVAMAVLGLNREVEETPGVSLWAATGIGPVEPVRLFSSRDSWAGLPASASQGERTLLLIPDPFTFPSDRFVDDIAVSHPQLSVIGGLASGATHVGGNRLALGAAVHRDGAVGALLSPGIAVLPVVSQGCRPVGQPYTVTRGEGNLLVELGGMAALRRLQDMVTHSGPDDRSLMAQGIQLGRVIQEQRMDFARGDFLIRGVMGADEESGVIAVGDEVTVGSTVQFQVRDADSADEDLRALLAGHDAEAALVFTCNGRGLSLFGESNHDATVIGELTGAGAIGGMFCAGEIGPIGRRSFLHGYTASIVLFPTQHGVAGGADSAE